MNRAALTKADRDRIAVSLAALALNRQRLASAFSSGKRKPTPADISVADDIKELWRLERLIRNAVAVEVES